MQTITCPRFVLFDIQKEKRSCDTRFLLTEDREEEPAIQVFTRSHFTVRTTAQEQKSERELKVQEGERGGGENSRWMLSGSRGQRVLH